MVGVSQKHRATSSDRKGIGLARVAHGNQVKRMVIHRQRQSLLKGLVLESSDGYPTQRKCHGFQEQVLQGSVRLVAQIAGRPRSLTLDWLRVWPEEGWEWKFAQSARSHRLPFAA
jgi:hypothetical protein